MKFSELALYFQKLENTTSRNAMTEILAELFKKASTDEIDKICYLTQGRVCPLFIALEFGMAEKMMIKAISLAYGVPEKKILGDFEVLGDLGKVAEELIQSTGGLRSSDVRDIDHHVISTEPKGRVEKSSVSVKTLTSFARSLDFLPAGRQVARDDKNHRPLSVSDVFSVLEEIAHSSGSGSVERKTRLLSDLLRKVDSLSARYIVRIPLAKMRLGFSEMTVLDSLSWMVGKNKEARKEIERAYNVRPDLGFIAKTVKIGQIRQIGQIGPEIGTPILMARAERLSSGEEIIEKIGKCAIEPKLDGFRVQVHFGKIKRTHPDPLLQREGNNLSFLPLLKGEGEGEVRLFSRNLEDVTHMYPDLVEAVIKQVKAKEAIFEGEAIGWDEKKQKYLPFQETTQRRRKYHIAEMTKSVPLKLVVFDLLYVDGQNLIEKPFLERRKTLEEILL